LSPSLNRAAPLAFAPLTGGTSLAGGLLGNLGSGLFGGGVLSGGMGLPMQGGASRLY
jgi:hypothetical protein